MPQLSPNSQGRASRIRGVGGGIAVGGGSWARKMHKVSKRQQGASLEQEPQRAGQGRGTRSRWMTDWISTSWPEVLRQHKCEKQSSGGWNLLPNTSRPPRVASQLVLMILAFAIAKLVLTQKRAKQNTKQTLEGRHRRPPPFILFRFVCEADSSATTAPRSWHTHKMSTPHTWKP